MHLILTTSYTDRWIPSWLLQSNLNRCIIFGTVQILVSYPDRYILPEFVYLYPDWCIFFELLHLILTTSYPDRCILSWLHLISIVASYTDCCELYGLLQLIWIVASYMDCCILSGSLLVIWFICRKPQKCCKGNLSQKSWAGDLWNVGKEIPEILCRKSLANNFRSSDTCRGLRRRSLGKADCQR